jgi:hypothetical protein
MPVVMVNSPVFYEPLTIALPQWVYDDLAGSAATITVPFGHYTLPQALEFARSNVDLDFSGSTIYLDPTDTDENGVYYPFHAASVIDPFVDPLSPARNASHLTGTITAATTQLTMIPEEIEDLTPGEIVQIVAGVNTSDPVEPYRYIVATVQSVSNGVITFTAALDEDVPVYSSEDDLKTHVDPGRWDKIGTWGASYGSGGNYKKGLGTDHGMLRYVGGTMLHDITVRNVNFDMFVPDVPVVGVATFFFTDVARFEVYNVTSNNFVSVFLHTWRCTDHVVDGLTITGIGRAGIAGTYTAPGVVWAAWGGKGLTLSNVDINATNAALLDTEVDPEAIVFSTVDFETAVVHDWTYGSNMAVIGVYGSDQDFNRLNTRFENFSIKVTGDNNYFDYGPYLLSVTFDNLIINQSSFADSFKFENHTIEGTITVGGVVYGPMVSEIITASNITLNSSYNLPVAFYKSISLRVTNAGGATGLNDGFGNWYNAALTSGQWTPAVNNWTQLSPGDAALADYLTRLHFTPQGSGAAVTIEFDVEYYPQV